MVIEKDDIVITGMSGRFPECDNIEEFKEALLNGTDLITIDDRRFPPGFWGTPERLGKIKDIESFDAGFFGISPKQAHYTDPRHRVLLETVFETIVDAGINPQELRGSKTGVYVGLAPFDSGERVRELNDCGGYANIGLASSICANRISFSFDFRGPSYILDSACSSGIYVLANAISAMEAGDIDNAIVAASGINLSPHEYAEFLKLGMASMDGACRVFSTDRNGYVRSETVASILLQRRSKARRIYSSVLGTNINCDGFKIEGITFPSTKVQYKLMEDAYVKYNVDPNDVAYVEAHGTGTQIGDMQECQTIVQMFCKNRKLPLPIGSVKSNVGHSEISAGLSSIIKVIIAMEIGIIPANIHIKELDKTIPGIGDGRLQVVTKNQEWDGGIAAINSFGFGGANAHAILKSHDQPKLNSGRRGRNRLVQVSGRTEEAVTYYLDEIRKHRDDYDFLALIDQIHKLNVDGHYYRGYEVLSEEPKRDVGRYAKQKRPVWFVYTGMGSQWPKMCKDLMNIEIYRNTFKRCAKALKPYNIDLEEIAINTTTETFDNIVNSFCAITAAEVALTDVLTALNIVPDGLIGHSLGEIGCAYADGALNPEEAILLAYARGYASINGNLPKGLMAAIGLGPEECQKLLPDDVVIACYNSSTNVTISGPEQSVLDTAKKFTNDGIFARIVNTGNFAYHSQYIAGAGPILLDFIKKVLPKPKLRSEKWLSSSVLEKDWNSEAAKYNSAEYHYNNFMNPVRFDQLYKHIPKNAIVVEVAPHALLQAILKKELGHEVINVPLVNRTATDTEQFFLANIGKIYLNGGQPDLTKIYNYVKFPVRKGTQGISSMIKWDHSVKWYVPYYEIKDYCGGIVSIDISGDDSYLAGHVVDGRVLMPASGYMVMVWNFLVKLSLKMLEEVPVVFENVRFRRATVLTPNSPVKFFVNIMKHSGYFEIYESGSVVASGIISTPKDISKHFVNPEICEVCDDSCLNLETSDVYKEFNLRRYMYAGIFKGVKCSNVNATQAILQWNEKWTPFLDTMIQLMIIKDIHRNLVLPTSVQKVIIDPRKHIKDSGIYKKEIPAFIDSDLNIIKAGGIEIIGTATTTAPRRQQIQAEPVLEVYDFVPYEDHNEQTDLHNSLAIALQIVMENNDGIRNINIGEVVSNQTKLTPLITEILNTEPMNKPVFSLINSTDKSKNNYDLVILEEDMLDDFNINLIKTNLREGGFVLYRGRASVLPSFGLITIYSHNKTDGLYLLRKPKQFGSIPMIIQVNNSDLSWVDIAKEAQKGKHNEAIYLVSQQEELSGIIGMVKCLILEPGGAIFKSVFIRDKNAEKFSIDFEFYKKQLVKDLAINVLENGVWGSYRHSPLESVQERNVSQACCHTLTPGNLSSFKWIERPSNSISNFYTSSPSSNECYTFYAALNFRDVMLASANLPTPILTDPTCKGFYLGSEYSGIDKNGRRVVGFVDAMAFSLQVKNKQGFLWEVPDHWSLEDAATVPFVYATVYYALIERGQMKRGESILIHAGSGGVGISAISVALSMDCTVYTTVGSEEKRIFLKNMFPQLKDENIGHSRNSSFEQMVLKCTKGKGVDLLLNSLSGDLFQASLRCLAKRGRFLEIGKADFINESSINAKIFMKNCTFHGVLLDDLFYDNSSVKKSVIRLVTDGIRNGIVKPLPRIVFSENEVENAFRYFATGKQKGKVLVKIRDEKEFNGKSLSRTIMALPRIFMTPEKVYILIGGLGGFGLELTNWLIEKGATKIVLNSRRNITNGYQSLCLKRWREIGVHIEVNTFNTITVEGTEMLVRAAIKLGSVGGVFHLPMVIRDGVFENQTVEQFQMVLNSKIVTGQNIDIVTRKLCPELEYFVTFSSLACGRGNAGQSNYGMANSFLEQLCRKRKRDRLPGLAVQWGPIGDVGYMARNLINSSSVNGTLPQNIESCLNALEKFMLQSHTVVASTVLADINLVATTAVSGKTPVEAVAHILGIKNMEDIDDNVSLSELGLDSLMTAEIKQTLYRSFNLDLNTDEIRNLSFTALGDLTTQETKDQLKDLTQIVESNKKIILPVDEVVILNKAINGKVVFFLPPIEGNTELMEPIAKNLNSTIYGLQFTKNTSYNSIDKYASFFLNEIKKLQKQDTYIFCAYSYGCTIAFEIALQLETEGHSVDMIFVDGSPAFVRDTISEKFLKIDEKEDPQSEILKYFTHLFDNVDHIEMVKIAEKDTDWETKTKEISKLLSVYTGHGVEELDDAVRGFYQRCYAGYYYKPKKIFRGKVTLVRSSEEHKNICEDFGLTQICEQKVEVLRLPGDHAQVIQGENVLKIAEIINKTLLDV